MGFDSSEPEQRRQLQAALAAANISTSDLWLYYFGIGGSVGEYEVEAYMRGLLSLPELQRDLLAIAAHELTPDHNDLREPYSDEPGPEDPLLPEEP